MTKKSIMVAEDDNDLRSLMSNALREADYNVIECANGPLAMDAIREQRFDALVVDVVLPAINGLQVIALAKGSKLNRDAAIIIASGHMDDGALDKAKKLGITDIFVKPFPIADLLARVKQRTRDRVEASSYDTRLIKCFVAAAKEVLEFYLGHEPKIGKPFVKSSRSTHGYVTGLIGFTGDGLIGSSSMTCDEPMIHLLAKKVFMDDSIQPDESMMADLAGEMTNQVIGKAKINFGKIGVKMSIGLPEVVVGKNHMVVHKTDNPIICIPIEDGNAKCYVEFSMAKTGDIAIDEKSGEAAPDNVIMFD